MIKVSGTLAVKSIKGSRGAFSIGELVTPVGEFKIKDQVLDQYSEGQYEGEFVISRIFPTSYVHFGRVVIEVRAHLADISINDISERPEPGDQPVEPDPAEEPVNTMPPVSTTKQSPDETLNTDASAGEVAGAEEPGELPSTEVAAELTLFGEELCAMVTARQPVKLDPTIDRAQFRKQRDHLKTLGYRFSAKEQIWRFEAELENA